MEKKLRIQLFTNEGGMVSDRLVTQDPELYKGPQDTHNGPIRIEFTLLSEEDIQPVKDYLDKLTGKIPLETKTKKVKAKKVEFDINQQANFLDEIKKSDGNQDDLINFLRSNGFVFVTTDLLVMMDLGIDLKKIHKDKYQWMIRLIKRSKNPKNDKYDPTLVLGISLLDDRTDKIPIYLDKVFKEKISVPVPEKPRETFKKSGMIKFPHYMELDEREKFRIELRNLVNNQEREPSKFFKRWVKWVENLPEITQLKSDKKE